MSGIKNIVIAGGSGSVGTIIVDEFVKSQRFNVFVLTREGSTSAFPRSVQVLKTDYNVASLTSLLSSSRIDAVVSNLSGWALGAPQIALVDAAKAAGVKRFLPSEFGSDTTNPKVVELVELFKGKKEIVDYLKTKEGDGFEWTSLITGAFLDWGLRHSFIGVNIKERKFYQWDNGAVPFTTTNIATIGKAIVNLLSTSDRLTATANKYVFISSHTITQNELFAAVRKATVGEDWSVEHVDSNAAAATARDEIAKGNLYGGYKLIQYITFAEGLGDLGDLRKVVSNDLLGLEKEDLDADVKKAVEEFKSSQ